MLRRTMFPTGIRRCRTVRSRYVVAGSGRDGPPFNISGEDNAMITMSGLKSMGDLTRQQARIRPDEVALVFEGRDTTFAQLDKFASQVANGLIEAGVKPQGRVGYMGKNSDEIGRAHV